MKQETEHVFISMTEYNSGMQIYSLLKNKEITLIVKHPKSQESLGI